MKNQIKFLLLTMLTIGLSMSYVPIKASQNVQSMKIVVIGGDELTPGLVAQIMASDESVMIYSKASPEYIDEMVQSSRYEITPVHLMPFADLVDSPRIPNIPINTCLRSNSYPVDTKPKGSSQFVYHNKRC